MPGIVDFPHVVQEAMREFADVFACEPRYFTCTVRIPNVNHKVRIVVLWHHKRDAQPCKVLVTNRINWEVGRILGVYRYRWTGTETFHRDGQQELGMGDCQPRDGQGQTRPMDLVMLAHSLLVRQLGHERPGIPQ